MKVGEVFSIGARMWQVRGLYLGGVHQENVVGITSLDLIAPDTPTRIYEMFIPFAIMEAALGRPIYETPEAKETPHA